MNFAIKQFYETLIQLINNCGLPIGTAYFILKDLTNELEQGYKQAAEAEINQKPEEHTQAVEVPETPLQEELKEEKEDGSSNTVTENL